MSTFNVAAQVTVPGWVRARALAVYGIVAQGGMAVGSAFWGLVAERVSLSMTLILAAGTLTASIATALRYRLRFEEAISHAFGTLAGADICDGTGTGCRSGFDHSRIHR